MASDLPYGGSCRTPPLVLIGLKHCQSYGRELYALRGFRAFQKCMVCVRMLKDCKIANCQNWRLKKNSVTQSLTDHNFAALWCTEAHCTFLERSKNSFTEHWNNSRWPCPKQNYWILESSTKTKKTRLKQSEIQRWSFL